jgi:hypothetical protein
MHVSAPPTHLADCLAAQVLHGLIIEDHTVITNNAVMAIRVVWVKGNVSVNLQHPAGMTDADDCTMACTVLHDPRMAALCRIQSSKIADADDQSIVSLIAAAPQMC